MTKEQRAGANLERHTARVLHVHRTLRLRFESAPDTSLVKLSNGALLQPECKWRKRLPQVITGALAQARKYEPAAIPLAIIRQKGGEAIACLPLASFALLVGIEPGVIGGRNA